MVTSNFPLLCTHFSVVSDTEWRLALICATMCTHVLSLCLQCSPVIDPLTPEHLIDVLMLFCTAGEASLLFPSRA